MPVNEGCLRHLQNLPSIHKDPFDRLLLCQAIERHCQLVTDDAAILTYPAPVLSL
jgi:PIN domain nuclease of toxin-antitoxin system